MHFKPPHHAYTYAGEPVNPIYKPLKMSSLRPEFLTRFELIMAST